VVACKVARRSRGPIQHILFAALLLAVLSVGVSAEEMPSEIPTWHWAGPEDSPSWGIAVFGGQALDSNFSDTVTQPYSSDATGDYMVALAPSRTFAWYRDKLSFEAELMVAYHFGHQQYEEFGGAVYARWHAFPWNETVRTTLAVGLGPSYTTIYPNIELQNDPNNRSRWLNQFNLEATFGLPEYPSTEMLLRLQHRSGMFGTMGGVWDGSNFVVVGLRQHF
jgi:hypothetical protein